MVMDWTKSLPKFEDV